MLMNTIMLMISAGILFSLRWMKRIFRPIEKLVYYFVIVIAIEQIHSAVLDNFKLLRFQKSISLLIFYKLNQLILFPVCTLWLLYAMLYPKLKPLYKMLLLGAWFTLLSLAYPVFQHFHVLELTGWNAGYSIVIWYVVFLETVCFCLFFRKLLREVEEHDPLSA